MEDTIITFIGTSACTPEAFHDTASFVINNKYLVDTGWCAVLKMLQYNLSPFDIEYLFITHCHHDHYIGLSHLIFYLAMKRKERKIRSSLKIVGPAADIQLVVERAKSFLQVERFPGADYVCEIIPSIPGESFEVEEFRLDTCKTKHNVEGLCYKFTDKRTGVTFAFTGDTAYHPPIAQLAKHCFLLIHEASHGPNASGSEPEAAHSGALDAARIAKMAEVERLVLIHCPEHLRKESLKVAKEIFPATFCPLEGQTIMLKSDDKL